MPKRTAASALGAPANIIIPARAIIGRPNALNVFFNISNLPGGLLPLPFHCIGCRALAPVAFCDQLNTALDSPGNYPLTVGKGSCILVLESRYKRHEPDA